MKNLGIWLDKRKALIITLDKDKEMDKTVYSAIEDYKVTANRHKGGAQEIVKDRTYLEREKNQFKAYFKEIIPNLVSADAILIVGPGETGEKLGKELKEHYPPVRAKVREIRKADSMTDNQVKALVRDFYKTS